ncbi:intraflagellar transport protein 43 homolog isoform X1 [Daphnia pulicaria]|uniref:intraflagellar transport protein 43 homolog isoform X1 n=1 Tax=Daphnia pulicaria TaxID=35523 RepID=UPI001EEB2A15|nr:intraflagellar transport protein 43 homolog isoform X1 [Daphnia pulicaria]
MHEDKKSTSPIKSNGTKTTSRFKKQGGWADETQQSNKAFSALEKRFSSIKLKKQESEEEVPVSTTSDLSNEDVDDLNIVSNLKTENHNRAAAYKELNANSISKQNMAQYLEGVDLRILTKNILPESQLKEADVPWNWDVLFAEMVPELSLGRDKSPF